MNNNLKKPLWQEISPKVKKIAILSWGKLGDMIATIPVSQKIKECFPHSELTLIGNNTAKDVYRFQPIFNHQIIWKNQATYMQKFNQMNQIRKQKFDLIVDQYHGDRSKLACILSRARYKVGFYKNDLLTKYSYNITIERIIKDNWYKDYRQILKALEIDTTAMKNSSSFCFDEVNQNQLIEQLGLKHKSYWIINLGAALDEKQYPIKNFVEVSNYLLKNKQWVVVLFNPDKPNLQSEFKNKINNKDSDLIFLPQLNLDSVAGIIAKAKAVISTDTGIMHLSCALKTTTIAIFVGIKQKVFIEQSHFYSLVEKNRQIAKPDEINKIISRILQI